MIRASVLRRVANLLLALVLAWTALVAGRTYHWCVPMQRSMPECCVTALRQREASTAPVVDRRSFELRSHGALASATEPPSPAQPERAVVAMVELPSPPPWPAAVARSLPEHRGAVSSPAVPVATGPPCASDRCAWLAVYRC